MSYCEVSSAQRLQQQHEQHLEMWYGHAFGQLFCAAFHTIRRAKTVTVTVTVKRHAADSVVSVSVH